ncbi:glutamyl-tRNA amidotransferase subunit A [Gymnopus androsaceus JB14]|uniref:Glutamyl-tRNA amidotransferase subunit A n=1 Tax=Gymnopus androsaceus JB14 TaxID=1447944 RepID=A0A6A4H4P0_9AGAR|nr:glutamyl-tRNA amidotransferase subunit A [Gymnopus androsaceus JB14]
MQIVNCIASALVVFGAANAVAFENASYPQVSTDYDFPLLQAANTTELFPMPACHGVVIEEATIDQLQEYMNSGRLTSVQLATCYLQRLYQTREYINPVIEINPDFFDIAAALDEERRAGKVRGPLHGIPFAVKDNIATKDRMQTTAGSWALQGSIVPRDAHVVASLRKAGALLFGKATLSEWADMRSNNYSEGLFGSSGSAVGVAANVFTFALGTETDGSVIDPAERNAVVGIKPTVGLTSRAGVIPESLHQDTVGTFGRTVRDATYVLDSIYGVDSRDNATTEQIGKTPANGYTQFLTKKEALKNATFGIPRPAPPSINNTEIPYYKTIVSPDGWNWDYGTTRGYPNESEYSYVKVDFYNNIKTYLAELENTNIRSLEDLVAFNYANDGTEGGYEYGNGTGIPAFMSGQDGFLASLESKGIMNETYWEALAFCQRTTREDGIDAALAMGPNGTQLDGLLVPPDVGQTYQIAAQAGYPMITVPAGTHSSTGMPFGLGLMQTAFAEAKLVKWASAIEDLQLSSDTPYKRTLPKWYGYMQKNIPVLNE